MNDPADPISAHPLASEQDQRSRFIHAHLPQVFSLICALTGDPDEAQELTQEAMIKILQRHAGPRDLDHAAGRLRSAAIGLSMEYLHRATDSVRHSPQTPGLSARCVPGVGPNILDALSVPERVAFILRDVEGLPGRKVARYMGCSVSEMRGFLAKARLTVDELSAPERRT